MLLTRQFCGAQFPRPIAELVAHDGLLSVSTPACPSRLLRIVVPCYARTGSDVHTVSAPEAALALLAECRLAGHWPDTGPQEMRNEGNRREDNSLIQMLLCSPERLFSPFLRL
jgi:hypothetical protein